MKNAPGRVARRSWMVVALLASGPGARAAGAGSASVVGAGARGVTVTRADFHGWTAIALRNARAEVLVVPDIGRVMRFGLLQGPGEAAIGPFWNHPKLAVTVGDGDPRAGTGAGASASAGRPEPDAEGWTNTGGDKAWPAPQSDWARVTGRGWPPPKAFDAAPQTATVRGAVVELLSAVDSNYGMRARRTIALDPRDPVMTIETTYEKVSGAPIDTAVWTIAQLVAPERLFILLPERPGTAFPDGYTPLLPDPPRDLAVESLARRGSTPAGRLLSLARDPLHKTMLASDGRALLWVGGGPDLLIETIGERAETASAVAPTVGAGARSQIYTSPGDDDGRPGGASYVELELLAPRARLEPGRQAMLRSRYTLIPRTETDPRAEAGKVWRTRR